MLVEYATVVSYQNGIAEVQCQAKQGCGSCAAMSGCGSKALSGLVGERTAPRFQLAVNEPLAVGEQIKLGLTEQTLLSGVLWLYALPLLGLVLSALLLSEWISNELAVAFGSLLCTLMLFKGVKYRFRRLTPQGFTPLFLGKASGELSAQLRHTTQSERTE